MKCLAQIVGSKDYKSVAVTVVNWLDDVSLSTSDHVIILGRFGEDNFTLTRERFKGIIEHAIDRQTMVALVANHIESKFELPLQGLLFQ